ncbi:ABC transporter, ATP-binding protein [Synechococcus sp. PCC 7335]|uniref:ABC transporter ATP-binding protein n=1 Tax=Synechococcus sp. (strain ATCC 29403 / PCC 7335) TaxID=91464 RepID=UPI00017EB826|nr:ABC transporter ATP-binding protein [Synechococcus sp. PCC 7335]EDX85480.1 ABC transporter, ATP-binding protein [Synechococcus sp. PCC 7335]
MPSVPDNLFANQPSAPSFALSSELLKKSYGRGKNQFEAVRGVSLKIAPGEVLAFLGPNGAGKTTTIKMIAGLIRPDAGRVEIAGRDPHRDPQALQGVGAVLEGNRNLYWRLTPLENLEYFGALRQVPRKLAKSRGMDLLKTFGLVEKRNVPVQKLSRGMQQKIAIAVALIHQPHLLLLDEPTLGLDVEAGETVKQLVRQVADSGCAILLTTHQLSVAESLSDRVAIIREGTIVIEQTTQALIRQFSKDAGYYIEIEGRLDPDRRAAITALGATVGDSYIHYYPNVSARSDGSTYQNSKTRASDKLYKILSILDPLPLVEIRQERANLTDIFLQLIKQ